LPLKTDDLKTVDSYKKAVKADGAKISSGGKIKFWVYRDVDLPTASGQKQKLPALIAFFDDTAVKGVLKGKQPACRGICGLEEGKIAFEAAQGNVPYGVLVKSVPPLLGKNVHIPTGADMDTDGAETSARPASPAPAGPAPSPGGGAHYAELNAVWKQLSQQASQRSAANPAERATLGRTLTNIAAMLQGGQLAEAEKQIHQLQAALKIPQAPAQGPEDQNPAKLNNAWIHLSKQASQRMASNPGEREILTKAMAGIPEMLEAGRLDDARKGLEKLQAALKAAPAGPASLPTGDPVRHANSQPEAPGPYPGIIKYRAALAQFAQAKSAVRAQIQGLQSTIVARVPQAAGFAKQLAEEIEELNKELGDAVDEAMKSAESQASPVTDAVKLKIRKYLADLASNGLIREADSNPFGAPVTIAKTLGVALARIRDAMPA
jgi:hypothetical protein